MSINWVMLDARKGFVRLPGEELVYESPARTSIAITTPHAYPANNAVAIQSNTGIAYLTNQRIVYLPSTPTKDFQSFSAPLLNLHDTHIVMPWFGSNSWQAVLQPVPGGNLPLSRVKIEVKLVFNEGGAADFHSNFERIKERLHQAVEAARDVGSGAGHALGSLDGVNMDAVHLDELPAYEASRQDAFAPVSPESGPPGSPVPLSTGADMSQDGARETLQRTNSATAEPPNEPPPGYEETQQQSIRQEFERRFSGQD